MSKHIITFLALFILGSSHANDGLLPEVGRGLLGKSLMIRIENVESFNHILDITIGGESVYDQVIEGIENSDITYLNGNHDRQFYLQVKKEKLIQLMTRGGIDVVTDISLEYEALRDSVIEKSGSREKWLGNPSVEIKGYVKECRMSGFNFYSDPVPNSRVEATMGGIKEIDYTRSNGYYQLYWAPGSCESSVKVTATSGNTFKYIYHYADIWCWGFDSDDTVDFFFHNGINPCY